MIGVDASAGFLASAHERFPQVSFARAELDAPPLATASVGGVLAWYSLIHTPPTGVPAILRELARVLTPAGSLLLGFFDGRRRPTVRPHGDDVVPLVRPGARFTAFGARVCRRTGSGPPGSRRTPTRRARGEAYAAGPVGGGTTRPELLSARFYADFVAAPSNQRSGACAGLLRAGKRWHCWCGQAYMATWVVVAARTRAATVSLRTGWAGLVRLDVRRQMSST